MKRKATILREKNSLPSLSPIHSQKRNVPSLRSSTRSLPYRLDRGGHARFLAGWLAARLNGLTFSRAEFRSTSFHFAQSGHTRAFGQAATISSAYYAIISLTSPSRGRGGGAKPRNKRIWRRKRKENWRERGEKSRSEYLSGDRSARACNSHTLDSCTRFVPSVTSPCVTRPRLRAAPACTRCTG